MNLLNKIGWHGKRLLISVAADLERGDFYVVLGHKKGDELLVVAQHSFEEMSALKEYLLAWPGIPISLCIRGAAVVEQILHRQKEDVISQVLGVKVDSRKDFLFQSIPVGSQHRLVAIIRKDQLEVVMEQFGELRSRIIYLNLSEAVLSFLLPSITDYSSQKTYRLELEDQAYCWKGTLIAEIDESALFIPLSKLGQSLKLPLTHLYAYASMLHFYVSEGRDGQSFQEVSAAREAIQQKTKLIRIAGWSTLVFSCLLLLSLGLHRFFLQQSQEAQAQISNKRELVNRIQQNEEKIAHQQAFLQQAGQESLQSSQVSFYIDQLMAQAPPQLYLDLLLYKPSLKERKKIDAALADLSLDQLIQGWAKQSVAVSDFARHIQDLAYVKSAVVHKSTFDFEQQRHQFTIYLIFHHE